MLNINFDMDGTIADLYGVENWLNDLINENTRPYAIAKPLIDMIELENELLRLKTLNYKINIISWLSKNGSQEYNDRVTAVKIEWLKRHLPKIEFNEIHIIEYGTPKENYGKDILFDDEEKNRKNWNGIAYDVYNILEILKNLK